MPEPIPLKPLLAAFAVHERKLFGMFINDESTKNSLKYLGRAKADGQADTDRKEWHASSLETLNKETSEPSGDHITVDAIEGSAGDPPTGILETPWYVIFEFNPDSDEHGDLWVGRFFKGSDGPETTAEGVFAIEANSDVKTFDAAPALVGELAARSVIISARDGTGEASAEGNHGGSGTTGIRTEW